MNTLTDYLLSVLIGCSVVFTLMQQRRAGEELNVDATVSYMAKSHMLSMANWMVSDVENIGAGVATALAVVEDPVHNAQGVTTSFAFQRTVRGQEARRLGLTDTLAVRRFIYDVRQVGTTTERGATVRLYQLRRCLAATAMTNVCSASSPPSSAPILTGFRVDLLDAAGRTVGPDSARFVRVRVSSAIPLPERMSSDYLPRTFWGTTLQIATRR